MPARAPGPIAAPEPLLAVLGEYRQLHLALAEAEPGHAWLRALERPTELEIEAVAAKESALAAEFSDLLLAVLASRVPHLEDAFELELGGLPGLAADAWALGCPAELLAVARQGERFFCVQRREHAWSTTTIAPWHPDGGGEAPRGLLRWLKDGPMTDLWDVLIELRAIDDADDEPLPPAARPDAAVSAMPRLVLPRATLLAAAPWVRHPKFGVGRVLREVGVGGDRKLEIAFEAAGVRTILARFVTELPADS